MQFQSLERGKRRTPEASDSAASARGARSLASGLHGTAPA